MTPTKREKKSNDNLVAADCLRDAGFDELADVITGSLGKLIGQRVCVYGPNYIWRGVLVGVTQSTITLDDCHQVFETGDHGDPACESEKIGDGHVFLLSAVCNLGPALWA